MYRLVAQPPLGRGPFRRDVMAVDKVWAADRCSCTWRRSSSTAVQKWVVAGTAWSGSATRGKVNRRLQERRAISLRILSHSLATTDGSVRQSLAFSVAPEGLR